MLQFWLKLFLVALVVWACVYLYILQLIEHINMREGAERVLTRYAKDRKEKAFEIRVHRARRRSEREFTEVLAKRRAKSLSAEDNRSSEEKEAALQGEAIRRTFLSATNKRFERQMQRLGRRNGRGRR